MGFIVFVVFGLIWYLPLYRKHRKNVKEPARYYIAAFGAGVLSIFLAVLIEVVLALAMRHFNLRVNEYTGVLGLAATFLRTLIVIAIVEEGMKGFFGSLVLKFVPDLTEAGAMLIMGMTGLGFECVESIRSSSDWISGIIRGITDVHLFFQMWMGIYIWRAWEARRQGRRDEYKKNMLRAFIVPVLVHTVYDWFWKEGLLFTDSQDTLVFWTGFVFIAASMVIGVVYVIRGLRRGYKTVQQR